MYYMFDNVVLLAKGKPAYCGPVRDAMDYFSSVGLHCDLQYNPADYMCEPSHSSIIEVSQKPCVCVCGPGHVRNTSTLLVLLPKVK